MLTATSEQAQSVRTIPAMISLDVCFKPAFPFRSFQLFEVLAQDGGEGFQTLTFQRFDELGD